MPIRLFLDRDPSVCAEKHDRNNASFLSLLIVRFLFIAREVLDEGRSIPSYVNQEQELFEWIKDNLTNYVWTLDFVSRLVEINKTEPAISLHLKGFKTCIAFLRENTPKKFVNLSLEAVDSSLILRDTETKVNNTKVFSSKKSAFKPLTPHCVVTGKIKKNKIPTLSTNVSPHFPKYKRVYSGLGETKLQRLRNYSITKQILDFEEQQ